jgi:hypothetical protein
MFLRIGSRFNSDRFLVLCAGAHEADAVRGAICGESLLREP